MNRPAKTLLSFFLCLFVFSSYSQQNRLTKKEKSEGWVLLFDGSTSAGWMKSNGKPFPEKGWTISDGTITLDTTAKGGDIVTVDEYGDFELVADFKIGPTCNSGIKYFYTDYPKGGGLGMEYQVMDDKGASDNKLANHLCGSLYDIFPPDETKKKVKPLGEWNTVRIVSKGRHVEHWLNGVKILQFERGDAAYLAAVEKKQVQNRAGFWYSRKGPYSFAGSRPHGFVPQHQNQKAVTPLCKLLLCSPWIIPNGYTHHVFGKRSG